MKFIAFLFIVLLSAQLLAEIKIVHPLTMPTGPNYNNGIIRVRATVVNGFGPFELELFKDAQYTGKKFTNVDGEVEFTNLEPGFYAIDVRVIGNPCKTTLYAELINCALINIHSIEMIHHYCYETQNAHLRLFFDQGASNCLIQIISNTQQILASKTGGPGQHDFILNNPPIGIHKIMIKDPVSLCVESKPFEIKAMPGLMAIKNNVLKRTCYSKGNITIGMLPQNRKYHYQWSDGFNTHENDMSQREINYALTYHLTVTDETTLCEKIFPNIFSAQQLPYFPIYIKSYKDASGPDKKDGEVDIWLYGNQQSIVWNAQLITTKDGMPYPDATFQFSSTYQLKVPKLLPGLYQFTIEDAKGCPVTSLTHEIYSCPVKPEANINIYSYSLPPTSPGAYIKANAYYSGDQTKCKYFWYIFNNPFYFKFTSQPELTSSEINSLAWNDHDKICVRMLCPCTTSAYDCVQYDPCPNNNITFKKKEIVNLCNGTLPTGKYVSHRENGSIHLEIDVTKLQLGFKIGKIEFDHYIHDIRWSDGVSVNYVYQKSNKVLVIDRNVTESKTYTLIITDGLGCAHYASLEVGNDFRYDEAVGHCFFWTACEPFGNGVETFVHYEHSIHPGTGGECDLELWCGNTKIRDLSTESSPYFDEREIFEDEEGNCYTKKICIILDDGDIHVDLSLPQYDKLFIYGETNEAKLFLSDTFKYLVANLKVLLMVKFQIHFTM